MKCLACTAETNGVTLCADCTHALTRALTDLAAHYTDALRITPGQRVKVRTAYQSTPPPPPTPRPDPVSRLTLAVDNLLAGWCRILADQRPQVGRPPEGAVKQAGWLEGHTASILTLEWSAELLRDARQAARRLRRLLDHADTGWYAGVCGNEIGREETEDGVVTLTCPRPLYGTQASAWVRCPECGRTYDAGLRREVMLAEARDELTTVAVIAAVVVGFVADEASVAKVDTRIRKAVKAGRLRDYGVRYLDDGRPHRVYRIGDVFDLFKLETERAAAG